MFSDVFVYLFTFIIFIIKLHIISGAVCYSLGLYIFQRNDNFRYTPTLHSGIGLQAMMP